MRTDKWCRRKTIMYNSLGVAIEGVLAWVYGNNVYYCFFNVKKNIVVRKMKCLQFTASPNFQIKT